MNFIKIFFINIFIISSVYSADFFMLSKFDVKENTSNAFSYVIKDEKNQDEIKAGLIANPETLLPNTNKEKLYEASLLHDSLFKKDLSNNLIYYPLIAKFARLDNLKNWVEFVINEDAKFSDGEIIKAEDIEFSYKYYLNNGDDFTKAELSNVSEIKILPNNTIRFDLRKQSMNTILFLSTLPVLSKKSWNNSSITKVENISFSGPYILQNKNLKEAELILNENYGLKNIDSNEWQNNFKKIIINSYGNPEDLTNAISSGKIDFALDNINSKKIENKTFKLNYEEVAGIFVNTAKFKTMEERRGLLILMSAYYPVKNASLFSAPSYQGKNINVVSSAFSNYYSKNINKDIFSISSAFDKIENVKDARVQQYRGISMLKDAGYKYENGLLSKNGMSPTFNVLINKDNISQMNVLGTLQSELKQIGINLKANVLPYTEYKRRLDNSDYDFVFIDSSFDATNINDFKDFFIIGGKKNYAKLNLPELKNVVESLNSTTDINEYYFKVKLIDKIVMFDYVFFPTISSSQKTIYLTKPITCPDNISEFKISLCNL